MNIVKNILFGLFLPFILLKDIYKSQRSVGRKIGYFILITIVFGFIWWNGYQEIFALLKTTSYKAGITDKLTKIPVKGTSMLPTIQDGSEIELKSPRKYGLTRGDIVSFINNETRGLHYLKRIIGLPEEQITIKNGYIFINGKALQEDYTLNNLPTFGNTALIDCESYTIPKDQYMVLGDNRTVSSDSRVLGFIREDDIDGVIKTSIGEKFASEQKQQQLTKVNIDPEVFLKKLNEWRVKNNSPQLVTHPALNQLADKRVVQIRDKFNDWKNKSVPADKMLEESGYRFNKVYELVTFGYLDEQAVLDQIFDSADEKNEFLSTQYTEVGIATTEKTNKQCTFPIISVILSWPAVPTYDQKAINSWAKEISLNNQSLANLQSWVGAPEVNQLKLKQLIDIIAQAQQIATRIYNKEKGREWLAQKDYQDIKYYEELIKQTEALNKELFGGSVKGVSIYYKEGARRY